MSVTPSPAPTPATATTLIRPPSGWAAVDFAELWRYRELLGFFTVRDIKARYKQTALGPLWVIIPPLLQTGIFTVIFGSVAGLDFGDVPPALSIFIAMLGYNQFALSFTTSASGLMANQHIFTKVYFPRLIMPMASSISGVVDLLVGLVVLAAMMAIFGFVPAWTVVFLPLLVGLSILTGLSLGLWLAALSVRYRDIGMAGNLLSRFILWTGPVAFPAATVLDRLEGHPWAVTLYQLNPIYWLTEGARWAVLGSELGRPTGLTLASVLMVVGVLISGLYYFRRVEANFADVV